MLAAHKGTPNSHRQQVTADVQKEEATNVSGKHTASCAVIGSSYNLVYCELACDHEGINTCRSHAGHKGM